MKHIQLLLVLTGSLCLLLSPIARHETEAAVMGDYCIMPPFITQVVPPLLMFTMDKEHRLFTEAYSDSFDLDEDGRLDTTYKHSIDYYGYFDYNKCYTYSATNKEFNPVGYSSVIGSDPVTGDRLYNKFCNAGQWSGNILNWLTMSRMDVLKKVLYGGQRVKPESTSKTKLVRVSVPHDAHAFGKEYTGRLCSSGGSIFTTMCSVNSDCNSGESCVDKSTQLIGISAPPGGSCTYTSDISWTPANGKILVAKYKHAVGATHDVEIGADTPASGATAHQNLMNSFVPANLISYYYINDFNFDDTSADNNDLIPTQRHGSNISFIAVAEFNVISSKRGDWQFALDSDDGAELYIDGTPVASYYSITGTKGHTSCLTAPAVMCDGAAQGTINLSAAGYKRLVVRATSYVANSGIRVWYKRPGDISWNIFGQSSLLDIRSPIIPNSAAACTMQADDFILTGQPLKGAQQRYHLFCNRSEFGNNSVAGPPQLRMLTNRTERIWNWIAREVTQCEERLGTSTAVTPTDYNVVVEVCNSTAGLESNCKQYGSGSSATSKPVGLLQKYGDSDGTKVCSKTMFQACANHSDCRPGNNNGTDMGMCVDRSKMFFGLISGSYTHNLQGGVLRKNILSISDEVNPSTGFFKSSADAPSNMLETFDKLQIIDYKDSNTRYLTCVAPTEAIEDGKCRNWGNPLAEIIYESLRYFAGKGTPTADFDYPQGQTDGGLDLPHPSYWGYVDNTRKFKGPYDIFPSCSKPFILLMSDVYPSFDADQLPGVTSSSYKEDTGVHPILGLDNLSGSKKYLGKLLDDIANAESVTGNNYFIGNSGTLYDLVCSSKTVSSMSLLLGLCPEQPTRQGSFYTAALAYYAHSFMKNEIKKDTTSGINNTVPNATTFSIAVASQVGNWSVKIDGKTLRIVPFGKTVTGNVFGTVCKSRCTFGTSKFSDGSIKSMTIQNCLATAYCPTNEIVKAFVDDIRYDAAGNPIYLSFRVNYADVEQGLDFDMDAVALYEVCTQAAKKAGYGTCSTDMNADQVEIKVVSEYAAGDFDQALGFVVSGSSEDGTYLVVRGKTVSSSGSPPGSLPLNWSHVFTVRGSNTYAFKDPLWYAAKWGGFEDKNSNNLPDKRAEWAQNCTASNDADCNPDNYYLVTNPLKLQSQMERAFNDILNKVSSGTAASILNNSEGSGATLLQAIFYPKKSFENQTELTWSGELMNLWYYVDPFFTQSTIREDTDYTTGDHELNLANDKRIQFYFDSSDSQMKILRYNFDGTTEQADINANVTGGLKNVWTAGKLLWKRDISSGADPRKIYTTIDAQNLIAFSRANAPLLQTSLNAEGATDTHKRSFAEKVIDYVNGIDVCLDSSSPCTNKSRNRTVDIKVSDTTTERHVWKLGDIISSTPRIEAGVALQSYDQALPLGYSDKTYKDFYNSANYKNRGMVYVGANDGMLHAFKLGKMAIKNVGTQKATLSGTNLGREEWAFIPKQVMPYLKYLTLPDYDSNHLYLVDGANSLFDVSTKTVAVRDDYWNETRSSATWKTVLLGGMGLGGASKNINNACIAGSDAGTCVKTPVDVQGFSSYFALDVTNQDFNQDAGNQLRAQPTLLWEFSHPELGYSTSGPAIVRLNSKTSAAPFTPKAGNNGRWFAIYASGPTGPIDSTSKQFKGKSDQNLKLFIVDMEKGPVQNADPKKNGLWIIDTGITQAFAGSISNNATVDAEMIDSKNENLWQDDVLYVGYTKKAADGTWTDGGVLRLVVPDSANPDIMDVSAWKTSVVVGGIGPVTTTISKLMSKNNLYLFFGTGRYFYPQDDMLAARRLFMVKEKCYPRKNLDGTYNKSDIIETCDSTASLALSDLTPKTAPSGDAVANGWYIDLDVGERVVTDTLATVNGAVFYSTYKPTTDICGFGGKSYLWGVKYDTGEALPASAKKGKVLVQLSTGAFAEIDLATALTGEGGRRSDEMSGQSSTGLLISSAGLTPVKRIVHIQERYK